MQQFRRIVGIKPVRIFDDDPDLSYLMDEEQWNGESDEEHRERVMLNRERLDDYNKNRWCMTGVGVVVTVECLCCHQKEVNHFIVWGVEDDVDPAYWRQLIEDHISEAAEWLKSLDFNNDDIQAATEAMDFPDKPTEIIWQWRDAIRPM